jgi:hypothetical protein
MLEWAQGDPPDTRQATYLVQGVGQNPWLASTVLDLLESVKGAPLKIAAPYVF